MTIATTADAPEVGTSAVMGQLSTRETVWAIVKASSGNLVEWFDFYIYAFFSVYFAEKFFTGTGQTGAFMQAAGVQFTTADPAFVKAVEAKTMPVIDAWVKAAEAKGMKDARKVLADYRAEIKKLQ